MAMESAFVTLIEELRRNQRWPLARIDLELEDDGVAMSRRTVMRYLAALANRRRFVNFNGEPERGPQKVTTKRPSHMIHIDVRQVGRILYGGGSQSDAA
ncbi:hypothetical protein [Nocardia testacea]|uniref:hypothetical protein n=1 Tax=Nocardia testacea TaxID=248551 RepID=UPI0033E43980